MRSPCGLVYIVASRRGKDLVNSGGSVLNVETKDLFYKADLAAFLQLSKLSQNDGIEYRREAVLLGVSNIFGLRCALRIDREMRQ